MKKISKLIGKAAAIASLAIPSWVKAVELTPENLLSNNFGETIGVSTSQDLPTTIARLINVVMGFLGIVAVIIVLIGGFMWMTAGGDEEKTGKARKLLFSGVIGLIIIFSAFAIARFVIERLVSATGA